MTLENLNHSLTKSSSTAREARQSPDRPGFAVHLLQGDDDIRPVQELLRHKDVSTTMIDTHVMQKGALGVRSLLDGVIG